MAKSPRLLVSIGLAGVGFALLTYPLEPWVLTVERSVRFLARPLSSLLAGERSLVFEPNTTGAGGLSQFFVDELTGCRSGYGMTFSGWSSMYVPLVAFLALVLATPIAVRRRARIALLGGLVMLGLGLGRLWVIVLASSAGHYQECAWVHDRWLDAPGAYDALRRAAIVLFLDPQVALVFPVLVWSTALAIDGRNRAAPASAAEAPRTPHGPAGGSPG